MNRERRWLILAIILLVPLGFFVKFGIKGPWEIWCNRYGAAILYEVFWVLVVRFVSQRIQPTTCGFSVFVGTSILEFLQLWRPTWLESVRQTFLGAAVLGSTFDANDFLYYAMGSYVGYLLLRAIVRSSSHTNTRI
jgi:hypothetical protein